MIDLQGISVWSPHNRRAKIGGWIGSCGLSSTSSDLAFGLSSTMRLLLSSDDD